MYSRCRRVWHTADKVERLMKANNIIYTCTLKIGESTYLYVGKVEQDRGWKHRMMCSLRQQSNCWIFGKALRIFPPSMWSVKIIKIATGNILVFFSLQNYFSYVFLVRILINYLYLNRGGNIDSRAHFMQQG